MNNISSVSPKNGHPYDFTLSFPRDCSVTFYKDGRVVFKSRCQHHTLRPGRKTRACIRRAINGEAVE